MTNPYDRIRLGVDSSGRPLEINARTDTMLRLVEDRLGHDLTVVQGSYMGDNEAAASAGTHCGGGCLDIRTWDMTPGERGKALLELRRMGFAAWYRTEEQGFEPHFHVVAIGDEELSPSAQSQVADYYDGLNGLVGGAPDDGPRVPIRVFDYERFMAGGDFDIDVGAAETASNPVDSDRDQLTDEFEVLLGTKLNDADSDDDGLSDLRETYETHSDPLDADTDDDGVTDSAEVRQGSDAGLVALPDAALDKGFGGGATLDRDADGLSDLTEARAGSDATKADSDRDGVSDSVELRLGSDLMNLDSDADGIADSAELEVGTLEGDTTSEDLAASPAGD